MKVSELHKLSITELPAEVLNFSKTMILLTDEDLRITDIHPQNISFAEINTKQLLKKLFLSHIEDRNVIESIEENIKSGKDTFKQSIIFENNFFDCLFQKKEENYIITARLTTDEIEIKQELEYSKAFYQALGNNIPQTDVYMFNNKLQYILAFGDEMKKFGYSPSHFQNNSVYNVFDESLKEKTIPLYKKALKGQMYSEEIQFDEYFYNINVIPLRNEKGIVYAGIAILRNITKDKTLYSELLKTKEDTQKASNVKSNFMANMSHEIRTPLNAIIGFCEQLEQTTLNNDQRLFLSNIEESSSHLLNIVNEILILMKLGAGKLHFDKVEFSIKHIFAEIYNALKIRAEKKDLQFTYHLDSNVPDILIGDPFRLKQVIINLVSNAIKFTHIGSVTFTANLIEQKNDSINLILKVADTGIGIDNESINKMFEEFTQLDSSSTRKYGGSGLGLTIVKKIVECQNGSISVSSIPNKGTEINICLPFKIGNQNSIIEKTVQYFSNEKHLKDKSVLLVDDDEANALLGETILKKWDMKVDIAKDGNEALYKASLKKYDIILMDIHLPFKNGIDITKEIRHTRDHINNSTKIIAITANFIRSSINEYYNAGINNYLIKPFRENELYNKICNELDIEDSKSEENSYQKPYTISTNGIDSNYNLRELIDVANGDIDFYNRMLSSFIVGAKNIVDTLLVNHSDKDWNNIAEIVHKAISSFRFLQINEVVSLFMEMEEYIHEDRNKKDLEKLSEKCVEKIKIIIPEIEKELILKS